jgi:PAS domain S-box-containing protein
MFTTGELRMVARRTVRPPGLPMDNALIVGVARNLTIVFAPWRQEAYLQCGYFSLVSLTSIAALLIYQRRQRGIAQMAAEREAAIAQTDNERARLRTVLMTIPDLVWLKDLHGVYLNCNPPFERLFGAAAADIVGKTDYDFVDQEMADFMRGKDRDAVAAGKATAYNLWITFANDSHRAYLETINTPMIDADGKIVGVLGISRDMTDHYRLEEELRHSEARLRDISRIDPLTGLLNRRAFTETVESEFRRSNRFGSPASLLMIDIDNFKQINDSHGHEAGDRALVLLADSLQSLARATDFPARYGGEEFVVLLTETELAGSVETAPVVGRDPPRRSRPV